MTRPLTFERRQLQRFWPLEIESRHELDSRAAKSLTKQAFKRKLAMTSLLLREKYVSLQTVLVS